MINKKGTGIRWRLISVIIPIVLIMIASYFVLARNMVMKISQDKLQAEAQSYTERIGAWTDQIFSELQVYLDAIEEGNFNNDAEILKYMEKSVDKNESYPVGLYMGDDSGVYLDGSGWVPGDDWVLVERDWYVDGKDNETLAFGEPYYDSMTGQVCVSASVRVDYDKAVRVLATDVYLDYVSALMTEIAASSEAKAFLVTGATNTVIAHPETDMMAVVLDDAKDPMYQQIGSAVKDKKTGLVSVKGDAGKYLACIHPVANTDWYLVTYVTERAVLSDLHWMEMYMVFIAIAATIILIFATLKIMNRVVKPVEKVTDVISLIAEGDFSQDIEVSGNDEIATMSNNMQMFISQMRGTISEISGIAEWLNKQSEENAEVSDTLMDASNKQADAMEMLDKMAVQLSEAAEGVSEQMEQLANAIRMAHIEGNAANSLMQESVEMSQSGRKDMAHINEGMNNISTSITALSEQIEKVGNATTQISNMVHMIMDIAEETNLLSLNASIEAARAGEAGRGFAVVAEQIGALAANSSVAADDISKLTAEICTTVGDAVEQMKTSVIEVEENTSLVAGARATFDDMFGKVEQTSRRVNQMIALVGKVDKVAGEMEQITASQVAATEQIVQSATELDEHMRTLSENSNTVAESAEELKKESNELAERMSQFNI